MRRCKTCGGTYQKLQDGYEYYHACPPLKDGSPRPDARDENINAKTGNIKKEGKGSEEV